MPFEQKQWLVSSRQNWFIRTYWTFVGIGCWWQKMDMPQSLKSNFAKRQILQLKHRASVRLNIFFNDLKSVALVVEGSDLGTSEDCFEPTASCINDAKKRQLVTRSGLSRLRCCVCHLTTSGRWIHLLLFENYSEQCFNRCVISRFMSLREMPTPQQISATNTRIPRSIQFLSCHHAVRDATWSQHATRIWKQASHWFFHR